MVYKRPDKAGPVGAAEVTAIGGRGGFAQSSDRRLRVELCRPAERCSKRAEGTDPEQLLAAAYASCFLSALREAGREAGVEITADANVTARIEPEDDAGGEGASASPGLSVTLIVDLPGIDPDRRQALVERAHAVSRCSRALQGGVAVRTIVD